MSKHNVPLPVKCPNCRGVIDGHRIEPGPDGELLMFNIDGKPHACSTKEQLLRSAVAPSVEMTDDEKALRDMLSTDTLMGGSSSPKTEFLRWWFSGKEMKYKTRTPHVLALTCSLGLATVAHTQDPPEKRFFTLGSFLDQLNQDFIDLAPTYKGLIREECRDMVKGMVDIEEDPMKARLGSVINRHA